MMNTVGSLRQTAAASPAGSVLFLVPLSVFYYCKVTSKLH